MEFWLKIAHAAWHSSTERGKMWCRSHPNSPISTWMGYNWCPEGSHIAYGDDVTKEITEPDFLKALHE